MPHHHARTPSSRGTRSSVEPSRSAPAPPPHPQAQSASPGSPPSSVAPPLRPGCPAPDSYSHPSLGELASEEKGRPVRRRRRRRPGSHRRGTVRPFLGWRARGNADGQDMGLRVSCPPREGHRISFLLHRSLPHRIHRNRSLFFAVSASISLSTLSLSTRA
jgi:hypothetical protein